MYYVYYAVLTTTHFCCQNVFVNQAAHSGYTGHTKYVGIYIFHSLICICIISQYAYTSVNCMDIWRLPLHLVNGRIKKLGCSVQ